MSRAGHMLAILLLLNARGRLTARQIADELEIHIRSVYRCIDALCVSGVPIASETGRSGGYSISDRFKLDPLFFDVEEQKALVHAAVFAREAGYPFGDALRCAITKLKRHAGTEALETLLRHEVGLEALQTPVDPSDAVKTIRSLFPSLSKECRRRSTICVRIG